MWHVHQGVQMVYTALTAVGAILPGGGIHVLEAQVAQDLLLVATRLQGKS